MNSMNSVRPSREGDQFHYLWASRRCLRLLHPMTDLVAISIEGPSNCETSPDNPIEAGVHQIDVAEYYGSEDLSTALYVRYVQLKHSSRRQNSKWYFGDLERTICGFAERYKELVKRYGLGNIKERFEFCFISNRPIDLKLMSAIEMIATSQSSHQSVIEGKIKDAICLDGEQLSVFCSVLNLQGDHADYWLQRADLQLDTNGYLPGIDVEAPVQIKSLVERKVTTEGEKDPCIRKTELLRVLGIDEDDIAPAPSRFSTSVNVVPRLQEAEIVDLIVHADSPVIIHAEGGVGKSVLSHRIERNLPKGSIAVVYDCFGNGEYRQRSSLRHRHSGALVQIANELATNGLCDPLLPVLAATEADYLRAFIHRVIQSTEVTRSRSAQSLVCIVVDAGDSAEIAAEDFGEDRSFVRDLLRESMPAGSRLVVMSRTERIGYLEPPSNTHKIELKPFSLLETACFLRTVYPDASDSEVDEFHSLTSQNPRVQSKALERPGPISDILLSLGPIPTNVDDTIGNMLESALTELRENMGENENQHVDSLCTALAILSPFIPIHMLASISGTEVSTVRSFANDFGGSLLVTADAVQFQDEPVESWFRTTFKPNEDELAKFISNLQVFATESAYVAYSLPQLMLDAGQLDELIELALSPRLLPDSEIEKRNVLVQRLQFALRASLKACRYVDAAKLAMKAAQETAGDSRRWEMFQRNTDLASRFLNSHQIREIVSRRKFENKWLGSRFAYEAGLLSCNDDNKGETLHRLRIVDEWIGHWNRLSKEEKQEASRIEEGDVAEIALARLNVEGPLACYNEISKWGPKSVHYWIGCAVADRLIDQGRLDDLNSLARSSFKDLYLLLAINISLREILHRPPKDIVDHCLSLLQNEEVRFSKSGRESEISAITAIVETAASYGLSTNEDLALLLKKYLPQIPPRKLVSGYSDEGSDLIQAYALVSELGNLGLDLNDLAHPDLRKKLENEVTHHDRSDVQEFERTVGGLFLWYKLRSSLSESTEHNELISEIDELVEQTSSMTNTYHQNSSHLTARIAVIWFEMLAMTNCSEATALLKYRTWIAEQEKNLYVPTWISLARLACHVKGLEGLVYEFVQHAAKRIESANEDAESLGDSYLKIAKVILGFDKSESSAYFQKAVTVACKIGDEIYSRWQAMIQLGEQASNHDHPDPELAYQFSRCAEISDQYIYRHFDYDGTVEVIAGLCPSSCLAIISRWRDRRFGDPMRSFVTAINHLSNHQLVDTKTVASLVCFRGHWDYDKLFNEINVVGYSSSDQKKLLDHLFYYMKFGEHPLAVWETFRDLANESNVDILNLELLIENAQHSESATNIRSNEGDSLPIRDQDQDVDWDGIFGNQPLYLPHGLSTAYSNYKHNSTRISLERFLEELISRIPGNKAVEFIQTYSDASEFDVYDFRVFLETLPRTWCSRLAVKNALAELVVVYCGRYCMEVSRNRYYQSFPIKQIYETTGISEGVLMGHVLNAIGKRDVKVDSDKLFTIVGLIAPKLTFNEARDALVFGVGLFDEVMSDEVGDGPWRPDLLPSQDTSKALAGYIWSALAAPQYSLRWEAAHVVRGICNLGITDVFDHLMDFARGDSPIPFVDSKLKFYKFHAIQWFMIALARASQDNPTILVPIKDYLEEIALHSETHVIIRHFAAKSALSLVEQDALELDGDVIDRLASVNKSDLPVIYQNSYERYRNPKDMERGESRFYFGIDMPAYWFNALGRCYALTPDDISFEAEKIILDEWEMPDDNRSRLESDARHRIGYFDDGETSHSHGSYPKADDLQFYLSYHSMMIVAGRLLSTNSLYRDDPDSEDEFESWLEGNLLTHDDGLWLSDRRDSIQVIWPEWKSQKLDNDWRWSVNRKDFNRALGNDHGCINLAGYWKSVMGDYEEEIHLSSALASPSRSLALVNALQTTDSPFFHGLPYAGDEREVDCGCYKLKGWIEKPDQEYGLDQFDPWSGSIELPPIRPAKYVRELLDLESEQKDQRIWQMKKNDLVIDVLWSYVWGTFRTKESEGENGRFLRASWEFLSKFLKSVELDLVVGVMIERGKGSYYRYYSGTESEELGRMPPYFKYFVFNSDGQKHSL